MANLLRFFGFSAIDIEAVAARVAEVALQRLVGGSYTLQLAHVRPAVARGYLRVHAAQAVRCSLGQSPAHIAPVTLRQIEQIAIARLTDRVMSRPTALAKPRSLRTAA
jgi:hypothetical protein